MAFRISTPLKNYLVDKGVVEMLAGTTGTAGTGCLRIYTGTQPGSADEGSAGTLSGTYGTLLCEIAGISWSAGTGGTGVFTSTSGFLGTAVTTGTAGWGRLEAVNAQGTCRVDGDVGTSGGNVFTINVSSIVAGQVVSILSSDIYMA